VGVGEFAEHGFFVVGHTAREIGIVEALITCVFRHVLQLSEFLGQDLLTIARQLLKARIGTVADVVALRWREAAPNCFVGSQILPLLRSHVIPLIELLADLVLLRGRKLLEDAAMLQYILAVGGLHVAHGVEPGPR